MNPSNSKQVIVSGSFDDLRASTVRFIQHASSYGPVRVLLWTDEVVRARTGSSPKFPFLERMYVLQALRFVEVVNAAETNEDATVLAALDFQPGAWVLQEDQDTEQRLKLAGDRKLRTEVVPSSSLKDFVPLPAQPLSGRKKVIVTGCYDWFHSGHVRFFEEVSALGDLFVVVGHDANIRLLKGEGHPLFPQEERCYLVSCVRYVTQALVSTGHGWVDAEPEIQRIQPDIYAVNEDGDRGGKREYCEKLGIEYVVLKRAPAPGLPGRSSTALRGF